MGEILGSIIGALIIAALIVFYLQSGSTPMVAPIY